MLVFQTMLHLGQSLLCIALVLFSLSAAVPLPEFARDRRDDDEDALRAPVKRLLPVLKVPARDSEDCILNMAKCIGQCPYRTIQCDYNWQLAGRHFNGCRC